MTAHLFPCLTYLLAFLTAAAAAPTAAPPPGEREFRCHRVFFAACSEYFRALLYGGMSESRTRRVELRDVAPEGFEAIIKYVYTGRLLVTAGVPVQQLQQHSALEDQATA